MDKNQAIVDWLITCPQIQQSPLYFNFINAGDMNKQIIVTANDKMMDRRFIDGSVAKRYTFNVVDFRSVAYRAIVKLAGSDDTYSDENIENVLDVQGVMDWVFTQNENRNFPNFGSGCLIDSVECTSDNPNLNGIDTSLTPALAKYSFSIRIEYIDKSTLIWNKEE